MDINLLNAVCIAVVSFVMVQVSLAMPIESEVITEYEPAIVDDTLYTESCLLCYAFHYEGACELCKLMSPDTDTETDTDTEGLMIKRSGNAYHPFLRGGYPKKSYFYNPLLRGSYYKKSNEPKPRIYHPFLRGGFGSYNPSG